MGVGVVGVGGLDYTKKYLELIKCNHDPKSESQCLVSLRLQPDLKCIMNVDAG